MCQDEIKNIRSKLSEASNLLDCIDSENNNPQSLGEDISKLINALSDTLLKAKNLPREFGINYDYAGIEMPMRITEIYKEDGCIGYHFVLPCLLDKREDNKIYNKTREHAKKCFREAFERYSNEAGFRHIYDKVRITYINHFKDARSMIDNDNIDTKAFTDMITCYILDDDNPDKEELYIKGVSDGNSYTEVFLDVL